ncbi:MAG: hypothetical protein GVY33_11280 [Alphaproteobacteria bacterium]|nr:hypothetical protein [Alphaproteobacteria bacterium]
MLNRDVGDFRRIAGHASDGPADFVMMPDAEIRARHGLAATLLGWSTLPLYGTLLVLAVLLTVTVAAAG